MRLEQHRRSFWPRDRRGVERYCAAAEARNSRSSSTRNIYSGTWAPFRRRLERRREKWLKVNRRSEICVCLRTQLLRQISEYFWKVVCLSCTPAQNWKKRGKSMTHYKDVNPTLTSTGIENASKVTIDHGNSYLVDIPVWRPKLLRYNCPTWIPIWSSKMSERFQYFSPELCIPS